MEGKYIILNFLLSALLIHGVIGERRSVLPGKTSSEQLKADRKPPVKTVTTEHGDVYDCINFFEQPAFDHPLLKNHDYHFDMEPSFIPNEISDNENEKVKERFKPKKIGCPRGTVPIRKTSNETFIEEEASYLNSQTNDDSTLTYYAGTQTKDGIGKIYGVSSTISIENPSVYYINEYSSSIISIGGGHEFLHAGWTVNEQLYGDRYTRFFIWMHAAHASCYNTRCPGFVIVNSDHPLDMILMDAGTSGGPRYETRILIYQEKENGNWWLVGNANEKIGFWPKRLFNTLTDGAYKAYYGGVVAVPRSLPSFPDMGTGSHPHKDETNGNAYSRHMTIVNQDGVEEFAASKSDILESLSERYVARNLHMHWYNRKQDWASTILFGGS